MSPVLQYSHSAHHAHGRPCLPKVSLFLIYCWILHHLTCDVPLTRLYLSYHVIASPCPWILRSLKALLHCPSFTLRMLPSLCFLLCSKFITLWLICQSKDRIFSIIFLNLFLFSNNDVLRFIFLSLTGILLRFCTSRALRTSWPFWWCSSAVRTTSETPTWLPSWWRCCLLLTQRFSLAPSSSLRWSRTTRCQSISLSLPSWSFTRVS